MAEPSWIRWFMIVFFALFAAWQFATRRKFAGTGGAFCSLALDEPAEERLNSAYQRLERPERASRETLGVAMSMFSLLLTALAAFTKAQVALLYAAWIVAIAALLALAYVGHRRARVRRVASLRIRPSEPIAAWYAWVPIGTTVFLPLLWLHTSPLEALLVTAAGIAVILLVLRVASLPALLSGEDVDVEAFVAARLRATRAANLLAIAPAPSLVFEAFTGYTDSAAHELAMAIAIAAFAVIFSRQAFWPRRPSQSELATSFHASV